MMKTVRALMALVLALALIVMPTTPLMAAGFYLDNTLGELAPEARAKIADPKPVQLLFQFTTNGADNARAAKYLKPQIFTLVKASGLFSEVSETPVANGAILMITIDNIPEKGAAGKGFGAGLTFGLAGKIVIDDYVFVAEYVGGPDAQPIKASVNHRLYTRVGRHDPPPNATEYKKVVEALTTLVRQGVDHSLNRVALTPAFGGVAAALHAAPAPAPAPTPEAAAVLPPAQQPQAPQQ